MGICLEGALPFLVMKCRLGPGTEGRKIEIFGYIVKTNLQNGRLHFSRRCHVVQIVVINDNKLGYKQ